MRNSYLFLLVLLGFSLNVFSQASNPNDMTTFCADVNATWPGNSNSGNAGSFASSYGCLGSTPNPTWYTLEIAVGGPVSFTLSQSSSANGAPLDVDFIIWGPFTSPLYPGSAALNPSTQVACSYLPDAVEYFTINNAQPGAYYIILITNFSNQPSNISLTQSNASVPGSGSTNCNLDCGLTLGGDFELCTGISSVLNASHSADPNAVVTYQWKNGPNIIPGETSQQLTINGPGTYSVIMNASGCKPNNTVSVNVTAATPLPIQPPQDIIRCAMVPGPYSYDLTAVTAQILQGVTDPMFYQISYYNNQDDALFEEDAITNEANYQSNGNETIYVRVVYLLGCTEIHSFNLITNPGPVAGQPGDMTECDGPDNDGFAQFDLTDQDTAVLGPLNPAGYVITYYNSLADANDINATPIASPQTYNGADGEEIFARLYNSADPNCLAVTSFNLIVSPTPVIVAPADDAVCASAGYTLPVIPVGNYYPQAGGQGTVINPGTLISQTQTIFIYAQSATNPSCVDEESFIITVNPDPAVPTVAPLQACDATGNPGEEAFNLNNRLNDLTGGDATLIVTFHPTQADAQGPGVTIGNTTAYTSASGPVWVRIENGSGCVSTGSFDLEVIPLPVVNNNVEYALCETAPGVAIFDLPTKDDEITSETGVDIRYYEQLTAAEQNQLNTITSPYTSGTKTIYARVDNPATGCFSIAELDLIAVPLPTTGTPTAISECDGVPNDGEATFDLTPAGAQAINGQSGLVATYHLDPSATGPAIGTPAVFESVTQMVYIKVSDATGAGCSAVTQVQLTVNPSPEPVQIAPYQLCENVATPGFTSFNLNSRRNLINNNTAGQTVTFYADPTDQANNNPIGTPGSYTNATADEQEIFFTVSNGQCETDGSFFIQVNPLPVIDTTLDTFYACEETPGQGLFDLTDVDVEVTQGAPGYFVTYYENQLDAIGGANNNITGDYLSGPRTVYVRVADAVTGCSAVTSLVLDVIPAPIAAAPAALNECDPNNDDFAAFNLQPTISQITSTMPNVSVAVFETPEDAEYNALVNAVPASAYGAYSTLNGVSQTLYIRVQSNQTDCYDIVQLQLNVHPSPEAVEPTPLEVCDFDSDGQGIFNLTTKNAEILGTNSPASYGVSYYTTLAAAELGQGGAIPNVLAYPSASATLFARVENTTNPAITCADVVELELIVNPLPTAVSLQPYTLCDVTGTPPDGKELFDLTSKIPALTNNTDGVTVTFHETYAQAEAGTPFITTPEAYQNQSTVQTLFVRVTNNETLCHSIVLMDIRVTPIPQLTPPDPADTTVCQNGGLGYAQFDLAALVAGMVNNAPGLVVTFHETAEDAGLGLNAIDTTQPYTNVVPYIQPLYVRAEDPAGACANTAALEITLRVSDNPTLPDAALDPIVICDQDTANQDGATRVNLTVREADIIAAAGPGHTITYYTSAINAEAGFPRITNPLTYNGTNGQVIYVRVENTATGCYSITTIALEIGTPLQLTTPAPYTLCDTDSQPNNARTTFDLTTKDNEILGPVGVGQNYTVAYFTSLANRDNNVPIATPEAFENTANAQTLFVAVTSPEGCRSFTTLTIRVLPVPTPDLTPDALERCDVNNSPDGLESFDLTEAEADIRDNDNTTVLTYYLTEADARAGLAATRIPTPAAHISGTGSVWVRVEANTNNPADPKCFEVVELPLVVNPLPVLGDPATGTIEPYAICEIPTDGVATFILNSHADQILVGLDATQYTMRFFGSLADAQNGTPALPNQYDNTTPGIQPVWVRVENNDTGCEAIGTFNLLVEPGATADEPDKTPFQVCDNDGTNDGFTSFDLTQAAADVLGTQNPAIFLVSYHTDLQEAEDGTNAIPAPGSFTNTVANVQTIYVRVTNSATVSMCHAIATIDIIVDQLPEPVITSANGGNTLCYDFNATAPNDPLTLNSGITGTGFTYQWYLDNTAIPGATGESYDAVEEGDYTVEVTGNTARQCPSDPSPVFTVIKSGVASIPNGTTGYTVSNAFSDNQTITINIVGYGNYEYRLGNGEWQASNVFDNVRPLENGYTVTVRDVNEVTCGDLVIENVKVIDFPRYFTPNGDGYHDTWNIIGMEGQLDAKIYIFDRYGKLIKQIRSDGAGWDGTMSSYDLPGDDYWFTIEYKEDVNGTMVAKEFKSHFALKR